jgi:hypothetical protein
LFDFSFLSTIDELFVGMSLTRRLIFKSTIFKIQLLLWFVRQKMHSTIIKTKLREFESISDYVHKLIKQEKN